MTREVNDIAYGVHIPGNEPVWLIYQQTFLVILFHTKTDALVSLKIIYLKKSVKWIDQCLL